jgi:hypothetical protein
MRVQPAAKGLRMKISPQKPENADLFSNLIDWPQQLAEIQNAFVFRSFCLDPLISP